MHYRSYAVAHPDENTRVIMISGNDEAATSGVSLLGGYSGAVNRRPQQKAFSGKGHTLSSGSDARKVSLVMSFPVVMMSLPVGHYYKSSNKVVG